MTCEALPFGKSDATMQGWHYDGMYFDPFIGLINTIR
jgi:hypothetical protein